MKRSSLPCLWRATTTTTSTIRSFSTTDDNGGDEFVQSSKRDRAAWLMRPKDSLVDVVADNLLDRLEWIAKRHFPLHYVWVVPWKLLGVCYAGACKDAEEDASNKNIETSFVVGDEEFLPVKESCLGLHWTNDLPGAMIQKQSRLALKPDGLFLAAILGGETELRIACTVAQMEREGGISPRLSPLAQVRDAGNLLTRAGFNLPGVDVDEYTVKYPSALQLIEHLRAMGETNALLQRNHMLKRETALATASVYESMFATEDGTIPTTFQGGRNTIRSRRLKVGDLQQYHLRTSRSNFW
ncbi:unnamed protein product [Camellia sinensis]